LIVVVVFGLFFGLRAVLNTPDPALTVVSGSMSVPYDASDNNFWLTIATPFDRTLSVGDIIIIKGVNPKDLNTNYPNSNIIVFHEPGDYNTLIVHRIISVQTVDGTLYFATKGDGNGNNNPWPETPTSGFDPWDPQVGGKGVPASDVVGVVVARIPWFGWVTIFVHDDTWGLPVIILIILIIAIIEFVLPMFKEKKPQQNNQKQEQPQNTDVPASAFSQFFARR
jgi:signal peptidase I